MKKSWLLIVAAALGPLALEAISFAALALRREGGVSLSAHYRAVGYLWQRQDELVSGVRDPLFGHQLLPSSRLFLFDHRDHRPYGNLLTNAAGFVKNNSDPADEEAIRPDDLLVLVTGGSTVAGPGVVRNEDTLPAQIEKRLRERWRPEPGGHYRRLKVLNGGVVGYNSSQELIRFLFDYSFLRPHLWLQVTGTNEAWARGRLEGGPQAHYNKRYLGEENPDPLPSGPWFPATQRLALGVWAIFRPRPVPLPITLRSTTEDSAAQRFVATLRMSAAVAKGLGVSHLCVLQPNAFLSDRAEGPDRVELPEGAWRIRQRWAKEFFAESRRELALLSVPPPCLDGSEFLRDAGPAYFDSVHYNENGTAHLADRLASLVLRRLGGESKTGRP